MIVYVQKRAGDWLNVNCYTSADGFDRRGYEVRPFTYEQLCAGLLPLDASTIVHGGVDTVRRALTQIGATIPPNMDLPVSLRPWCGREVWETTLGEVRRLRRPAHIKPLTRHKLFTGHVVTEFRDLIATAEFADETPVLASEIVAFASEWRVFVLRGEVVGIGHYCGDPLMAPDADAVRAMVAAFTDAPIAYALDVSGARLVEVNDAFALGCYGLDSARYTEMIEARWRQMTALW